MFVIVSSAVKAAIMYALTLRIREGIAAGFDVCLEMCPL
jgi:hypothetical protein